LSSDLNISALVPKHRHSKIISHTHTHTHTYTHTHTQRERETERDRETERERQRQRDREGDGESETKTQRQRNRDTENRKGGDIKYIKRNLSLFSSVNNHLVRDFAKKGLVWLVSKKNKKQKNKKTVYHDYKGLEIGSFLAVAGFGI